MNEQEKFLQDILSDQGQGIDLMDQPFNAPEVKSDDAQPNTDPNIDNEDAIKPKNRRERRLLRKLEEEREASIFLSGKLAGQSEAKSLITEESDYLKGIEKIYGTDTTEAILATDLLKKAIIGAREDAKRLAIEEIQASQRAQVEAKARLEKELDSFIDDIEDTYGVELTATQEKSFKQLLTKMSPKDRDGNIIAYADRHAVYEAFQDRLKSGASNQAKQLSARSMTQSGASKESTLPDDSTVRFLNENGII